MGKVFRNAPKGDGGVSTKRTMGREGTLGAQTQPPARGKRISENSRIAAGAATGGLVVDLGGRV